MNYIVKHEYRRNPKNSNLVIAVSINGKLVDGSGIEVDEKTNEILKLGDYYNDIIKDKIPTDFYIDDKIYYYKPTTL